MSSPTEQSQQHQHDHDQLHHHHNTRHHRSFSMSSLDPKPNFGSGPTTSILSKLGLSNFSPSFNKDKTLAPEPQPQSDHPISHSPSSSFSSTRSSNFTPLSSPSSSPTSNSPITQLLPNLFPVKSNSTGSEVKPIEPIQPIRRSSIGSGGIFGLTGMNNPNPSSINGGDSAPSSPSLNSGGLWRRFSLGGPPPLKSTTAPPFSSVQPAFPSPTKEQLPPVFEEPTQMDRGRTMNKKQSGRKLSPMGERMLRGPFHD